MKCNLRHTCQRALCALVLTVTTLLSQSANAQSISLKPVWRIQLRLVTADVTNAGTDDGVCISLNSGNATWLNYARNDFERNDTYTYDLSLENINWVNDITRIQIYKEGSDGWCLKSLSLYINGKWACSTTYAPGKWLDNSSGYSTTLTLTPNLSSYTIPSFPTSISAEEMESRIESIVGDALRDTDAVWDTVGTESVSVSRKDSDTLYVDLDLKTTVHIAVLGDTEIKMDVDFDLNVGCVSGKLSFQTANMKVNADVDGSWATDAIVSILDWVGVDIEDTISERVEDSMSSINLSTSIYVTSCPTVTIDSNGNIGLAW